MKKVLGLFLGVWAVVLMAPVFVHAHCDTLEGPVVTAARIALDKNDINLILIWVQKPDEKLIKDAFKKTIEVRKLGSQAKEMADMYFFETLVRIHRAGEGAPYTGLKEHGEEGTALEAADKAVETGNAEELEKAILDGVKHGLHARFKKVMDAKKYGSTDIKAGREFVRAYVEFIHYAEGIHNAAIKSGHHEAENEKKHHAE